MPCLRMKELRFENIGLNTHGALQHVSSLFLEVPLTSLEAGPNSWVLIFTYKPVCGISTPVGVRSGI